MASWNLVEGRSDCGYKVDQHVLEGDKVSAKVWSDYSGEVHFSFDTDDSPSISGKLYASGKTKEEMVEMGKEIVERHFAPKYL